jgi:hypothetical protein
VTNCDWSSDVCSSDLGWWVNFVGNSSVGEVSARIRSITDANTMVMDRPYTMNHTGENFYLVAPATTPWSAAYTTSQITGTVTANSGNKAIVGSATKFSSELNITSIIGINGDQQKVVSIANDTYIEVGTPWTSNVTGANAYNITPAGLSYLNDAGALYTTFKRFQIKIVLQSNDTSKVPILDNLRALALQL